MFKQLHSKGIGTETKVTPALSQTEEDKLWETGVINLDSPTGLLRAVLNNQLTPLFQMAFMRVIVLVKYLTAIRVGHR